MYEQNFYKNTSADYHTIGICVSMHRWAFIGAIFFDFAIDSAKCQDHTRTSRNLQRGMTKESRWKGQGGWQGQGGRQGQDGWQEHYADRRSQPKHWLRSRAWSLSWDQVPSKLSAWAIFFLKEKNVTKLMQNKLDLNTICVSKISCKFTTIPRKLSLSSWQCVAPLVLEAHGAFLAPCGWKT